MWGLEAIQLGQRGGSGPFMGASSHRGRCIGVGAPSRGRGASYYGRRRVCACACEGEAEEIPQSKGKE